MFKRSNDAVLTVFSPNSFHGQGCFSCSADHNVRIIKHQGKGKRIDDVIMQKPNEDDLYHFKEAYGELENFCPDHPLNTENYKRKLLNQDDVTAFCFYSDETTFMFSGYGDGLICCWDVNTMNPSENAPASIPLLGHTNKINHLEAIEDLGKLFSCSNDCAL